MYSTKAPFRRNSHQLNRKTTTYYVPRTRLASNMVNSISAAECETPEHSVCPPTASETASSPFESSTYIVLLVKILQADRERTSELNPRLYIEPHNTRLDYVAHIILFVFFWRRRPVIWSQVGGGDNVSIYRC